MTAARQEREEQRVIDSALDTVAVAAFKERLRGEWAGHRLLAGGFQRAGTYEVLETVPPSDVPTWGFGHRWMAKNWLISDPRVGGIDVHARELGRELAQSEAKLVMEAAEGAAIFTGAERDSPAQLLRGALDELDELDELGDRADLVVLASHHWRWPEVLELTLSEGRGGPERAPAWLPSEERSRFSVPPTGSL